MKHVTLRLVAVIAVLGLFSLYSCGDSKTDKADTITVPDYKDTVHITLIANDKMQYNKSEINVYAGQTIVFTLTHKGSAPVKTMGHNFTLLKKGTSVPRFAMKANKFSQHHYIPKNTKSVIVHTKLLGGGESDTITFEAPEKGTYDYICTFPGHYPTMNGKFIVH